MRRFLRWLALAALLGGAAAQAQSATASSVASAPAASPVQHVLLVSVDGLRGDALARLGPEALPTFARLLREGASTLDARSDADFSVTLPNHVAMVTGRSVEGPDGHHWRGNGMPGPRQTVHPADGYLHSVFDVVHEHGLDAALYATKSKFALLTQSYADPDIAPAPSLSTVRIASGDSAAVVEALAEQLRRAAPAFVMLHLHDPDSAGHWRGFDPAPDTPYAASLAQVDALLAELLAVIEGHPELSGRTALLLTADHGGYGRGHGTAWRLDNARVPLLVWGPGVAAGADLYDLNAGVRAPPGEGVPDRAARPPPIRNGEVANLALQLLGLPPVPGSTLNAAQDLRVNDR